VTRQVAVIERATFTIDTEDASGNFEGRFQEQGGPVEQIAGHCSVSDITFVRPKGAPVYRYDGIFVFSGERLYAKGTRTQIRFTPEEVQEAFAESASLRGITIGDKEDADKVAARAFVDGLNLVPDDWTGEKT
jgi:hypothetical protein